MTDQDTKPVEGVETTIEGVETTVQATEENTTEPAVATGTPEAKHEEPADIKADHDNVQDAAQSAPNIKDEEVVNAVEVNNEKTVEDDDIEPKRKWPSILDPMNGMLRVGRGGDEFREKSDFSLLPETDDPKAIRKQVEFYFSDSNLPDDKFLWAKTDGEKNKSVPLSLVCSFSRMKRFKPYSAVVNALKESNQVVVEGPEGDETIRRKQPCHPTAEMKRAIEKRSTYIKGFGEERKTTQFDIEDFVAQYGEFNAVRLRRSDDSKSVFKGSVFIEWIDQETANKFYDVDPEPRWKDHKLRIMPKLEYERQQALAPKKEKTRNGEGHSQWHGQRDDRSARGHRQSRGNHRGSDSTDWKKRRTDDQRNGFNNRRDNRNNRGRGRGNHRGRGGDRRQNDSNRGRDNRDNQPNFGDAGKPIIHTRKERETNGKRARGEDHDADTPPAKKVNTKEAVADAA
ncbi:hypothetical protein F4677DRAFT_12835 [Hypoxylon crocopeplum]|nr:hypothetical protein F4677DRAFT_12835 [Hypoxylon crocopeplum]